MKKLLLLGAAAALVFSLSSCDEETIAQMVNAGLLGSAEITVTGQNGFDASAADEIEFASTITDNFDTVVTIHGENKAYIGTLDIFANVNLDADGATLRYPFMGFQFSDTTTGSYTLSEVLTPERLRNYKFDTIADIIFRPSGCNVLVIAMSDTSWYVSKGGGEIVIDEYPTTGKNMKGSINNVEVYYFTESDVEAIQEHLDDPDFNLDQYFTKTAIVNGTFKSKDYPYLIHKIIEEAYNNRGLWEDYVPEEK